MEKVFRPHNYRQITKSEACRIQGFPDDFVLPSARPRWMKLIGNSIAVSLVKRSAQSVVNTGVFGEDDYDGKGEIKKEEAPRQGVLFQEEEFDDTLNINYGDKTMAENISDYLVKAASFFTNTKTTLVKVRTIGDLYNTLGAFKNTPVDDFPRIKNAEGNPLIAPFTPKEKDIVLAVQDGIDDTLSLGDNFISLLTSRFIKRQIKMLEDMCLEDINTNPLLCTALKLKTVEDLVKYNVYALATRSIVTSMGFLVQDLLLFSSPDVSAGYKFPADMPEKWDIVVQRLGEVKSFIEVKSGPNDLDKTQVGSYARQIEAVEKTNNKAFIGITYGKRDTESISINLFKQYLTNWENRTLIGAELWDYVSGNDSYHEQLIDMIKATADTILHEESIIQKIEEKVTSLVEDFKEKFESIEEYLQQLW